MPAYSPGEVHKLFVLAFNRGDTEAILALYEPNAVLIVDGKEVVGHERIRKAYERLLARHGQMTLETRAVIESAGLAVLHGGWVIEPRTGGGAEVATRGLSTEVVRKQSDGSWLFVIDNPYTAVKFPA